MVLLFCNSGHDHFVQLSLPDLLGVVLATAGRQLGTLPLPLADSVAAAIGWQVRQADGARRRHAVALAAGTEGDDGDIQVVAVPGRAEGFQGGGGDGGVAQFDLQ